MMRSSKVVALALSTLALTSLAALAGACSGGRFPVCKSNADCAANAADGQGGKVCFNLKCVECQYDSDCAAGKVCNRNLSACESILGGETKAEEPKDPQTSWEPANWDECAKRCKEQACLNDCDARYKKK
jgi:Cys-rich repeat protein